MNRMAPSFLVGGAPWRRATRCRCWAGVLDPGPKGISPATVCPTREKHMIEAVIEKWQAHLRGELPGGLTELLDDDVVFYSPIVYTPQQGKAITTLYLEAAGQTLPGDASAPKSQRGSD